MGFQPAILLLEDGTSFYGRAFGASGKTTGEVVFNTSMSGYQEILTDPSYYNQILTFTYPHIGNVGTNLEDVESRCVQAAGIIVREGSAHHSNFRATSSLEDYLIKENIVGISDIDTRALVLKLREEGAMMGIIATGEVRESDLLQELRAVPKMEGLNLVDDVTTSESYQWRQGTWIPGEGYPEYSETELKFRPHVVALDFGVKFNILRLLIEYGFRVTVVPATTTAEEILQLEPDAVFLSNGPGDPAAVSYAIETVRELVGKKPMFGICLGHQLLGLALGVPTYKLKFGHRGANHPVQDMESRKVAITSQNHGFASENKNIPAGVRVSHVNLNDNTVAGFEVPDKSAFSIQYHPEASPGPHDARYLFQRFFELASSVKGGA